MSISVMRRGLAALAVLLSGPALAQPAQQFPNRPVQMLIGFPAGGGADLIARSLQATFQARLGQPVVIRNVTGAGGTIASAQVAQAQPDGHIALFAPLGGGTVYMPHVLPIPFAPDALRPVCAVYDGPGTLMVATDSPFRTPQEVIAAARAKPGSLYYGTPGAGSPAHIAMAGLTRALNLNIEHVPFRGSADIALAMRAGQVQFFADAFNIATQLELRPIAVFAREPLAMAPELPLMRDLGYNFIFSIHGGIFVPKSTPEPVVQRWEAACRSVLQDPEALAALARMKVLPNFQTGADYASFLAREHEEVGRIVREAGIPRQD
ncbi:Bug family tripartite tricarboxylate transporter substrate binding protein [Muricoccus pecuniae]|uniref:Tripartite-type tricarboxylate transporter receptor subunit TctC n=1 Tax=Muricoccus pecuniae TaxID=693023 RepID=A0A840Y6H0_9PROT|nr:tripartite tricarboxylate transporter substrate binding protein [Roseomonas pecuniae]MBB5694359.1 tripartite-type tricarboxylate transporter receptor subunit TctC [Roseomonas pecuniae]